MQEEEESPVHAAIKSAWSVHLICAEHVQIAPGEDKHGSSEYPSKEGMSAVHAEALYEPPVTSPLLRDVLGLLKGIDRMILYTHISAL